MYRKFIYPLIIAIALAVYACASFGPLEGGAKDVTPPKIVESSPQNGTINFNGNKIQITFDEFIQVKDLQKQFVVSPPMKTPPVVVPKPKTINITFDDTLKTNTTYSLYFGNSIVDNNEGNPFQKFEFVFSTGDHIDSLSILGKILNSFDHTPEKDGMFVMLYPLNHDSVPRKTLPAFITKSDDKGWFKINHLYADTFLIFGLKDVNMNFMFDQPGEQIAFSDTLIVIDTTYFERPDSTLHKVVIPKDTTQKIDTTDFYAGYTPKIQLYYFKEDVRKQDLNSSVRPNNIQFSLIFELPEKDSVKLKLLNRDLLSWYQLDANIVNDTLQYWITDTSVINNDTLHLQVGYYKPDSTEKLVLTYDTLKLMVKRSGGTKNKKADPPKTPAKLSVSYSLSGNPTLDLNQKLYFEPNLPVQKLDPSKISLYRMDDTLKKPVKFTIKKDSILLRRYYLLFDILSDTDYELITDSGTFTSIFGVDSDSAGIKFKTQRDDYYGTIVLNLTNVNCPLIVQLTTEKGDLIKQKRVYQSGKVHFDYLSQGKYGFKLIYDINDNGVWDTGNWGKKIQPEKTLFYKGDISVRSSWDLDVFWELPKVK